METLKTKIEKAKLLIELEAVVKSIPNQSNGYPTKIQRILENAFWYSDLKTLEEKRRWMLARI
tara:strand:- start:2283 stop:2471 length:189 start_codon:yes stop_codon:yes gene_type:complete